jgi:hypothetical protein
MSDVHRGIVDISRQCRKAGNAMIEAGRGRLSDVLHYSGGSLRAICRWRTLL